MATTVDSQLAIDIERDGHLARGATADKPFSWRSMENSLLQEANPSRWGTTEAFARAEDGNVAKAPSNLPHAWTRPVGNLIYESQ